MRGHTNLNWVALLFIAYTVIQIEWQISENLKYILEDWREFFCKMYNNLMKNL